MDWCPEREKNLCKSSNIYSRCLRHSPHRAIPFLFIRMINNFTTWDIPLQSWGIILEFLVHGHVNTTGHGWGTCVPTHWCMWCWTLCPLWSDRIETPGVLCVHCWPAAQAPRCQRMFRGPWCQKFRHLLQPGSQTEAPRQNHWRWGESGFRAQIWSARHSSCCCRIPRGSLVRE